MSDNINLPMDFPLEFLNEDLSVYFNLFNESFYNPNDKIPITNNENNVDLDFMSERLQEILNGFNHNQIENDTYSNLILNSPELGEPEFSNKNKSSFFKYNTPPPGLFAKNSPTRSYASTMSTVTSLLQIPDDEPVKFRESKDTNESWKNISSFFSASNPDNQNKFDERKTSSHRSSPVWPPLHSLSSSSVETNSHIWSNNSNNQNKHFDIEEPARLIYPENWGKGPDSGLPGRNVNKFLARNDSDLQLFHNLETIGSAKTEPKVDEIVSKLELENERLKEEMRLLKDQLCKSAFETRPQDRLSTASTKRSFCALPSFSNSILNSPPESLRSNSSVWEGFHSLDSSEGSDDGRQITNACLDMMKLSISNSVQSTISSVTAQYTDEISKIELDTNYLTKQNIPPMTLSNSKSIFDYDFTNVGMGTQLPNSQKLQNNNRWKSLEKTNQNGKKINSKISNLEIYDEDWESDAEGLLKKAQKSEFRDEWSFPWTKGLLRFIKYVKIAEKIQLCRPSIVDIYKKHCSINVLKGLKNPYNPKTNERDQWPRYGIRLQVVCGGYSQDLLAWTNCTREDFLIAMPVLEEAINGFLEKVGGVENVHNGHNPFFNACRNGFNRCPIMRQRFKQLITSSGNSLEEDAC